MLIAARVGMEEAADQQEMILGGGSESVHPVLLWYSGWMDFARGWIRLWVLGSSAQSIQCGTINKDAVEVGLSLYQVAGFIGGGDLRIDSEGCTNQYLCLAEFVCA